MLDKYNEWIKNYKGDIFRRCVEVCAEMQKEFPELILKKGMVSIIEDCKEYQHCWLETSEGDIVDPTSKQWAGIFHYRAIESEDEEPIGKCINCGAWTYKSSLSRQICSDQCDFEFHSFL